MKRIATMIAIVTLVFVLAPFAQAQSCSGYHCQVGNCHWYNLIADGAFSNPSCGVWSYTLGGSRVSSGTICNWTTTPYGQLVYLGGLAHGGTIQQTVTALDGDTALDNFQIGYIVEITDMLPGDQVKVQITDITTGTTVTTDTFTSDTWCNSVSHTYNSAGWKGHQLRVKFSSTLAETSTVVKITNVQLWQNMTY